MAKELETRELTRDKAADRLEDLADRLRGDGSFDVPISNRTVHLSPPGSVGMEVGVRERSSRLRGSRESITITLDWKPT